MSAVGEPYRSYAVADTPAPPGHYRLFGADVSYYSAKVDAWLAYKRIPHRRELATREVFACEILPRVGYPVIPVLVTPDGATLQDTSEMIDALEAAHPEPPTLPTDAAGRFLCLLFELLCDEWIKVPALHYRWHYDADFAADEFGRNNDPALPPARQRDIGRKIAARFSGWCTPLGVCAATMPAIEADYRALLSLLDAHFAHWPTLLGGAPSLCDFALYGPLHAHMLRDPHAGALMRALAPQVVRYLEALRAVPAAARLDGELGALPATLLPVLRLLLRDYVPILVAQHQAMQAWLAATTTREVPRSLGSHEVTFGRGTSHAARGPRDLFSYDSWMLQRALDVHGRADAAGRRAIADLCATLDASPLLDLDFTRRLQREHFRLVRA